MSIPFFFPHLGLTALVKAHLEQFIHSEQNNEEAESAGGWARGPPLQSALPHRVVLSLSGLTSLHLIDGDSSVAL